MSFTGAERCHDSRTTYLGELRQRWTLLNLTELPRAGGAEGRHLLAEREGFRWRAPIAVFHQVDGHMAAADGSNRGSNPQGNRNSRSSAHGKLIG